MTSDGTFKHPKMALCLSGGGIPGWLYQIGVLTAMDDFLGEDFSVTDFDIFVGTSAGSMAAVLLANGISPDAIYKSVIRHQETYLSLQRKDFYGISWSNVWLAAKNLGTFFFREIWAWLKKPSLLSLVDIVFDLQEGLPPGIFSMDRFHHFIEFVMTRNRLKKNFLDMEKDFYVIATEIDTGDRFVFGRGFIEDVPISLAITASGSVPFFFKPVEIQGHDLIDGGVTGVAHPDLAVRRGAKLILMVNPTVPIRNDRQRVKLTEHRSYNPAPRMRECGPATLGDQILRIDCRYRMQYDLENLNLAHPEIDTLLIQPSPYDTAMFHQPLLGHESRIKIVQKGYEDGMSYCYSNYERLKLIFAKFSVSVTLKNFETDKILRQAEKVKVK
jgi:NTE family protein